MASYPAGFTLRIPGKRIALQDGVRLTTAELPGLESNASDGAVAEVVRNPTDPTVLGLKNLTFRLWVATTTVNEAREIPPGKSIKLVAGTNVRFGNLEGSIE